MILLFFTEVFCCYFFLKKKKLYCTLPFIVHVIEMWSPTVFLFLSYFKVDLLIFTPSVLVREICSFILSTRR